MSAQTEEIKKLCKLISSKVKQLFARIIKKCVEVLGDPPCDYEVVVLGSLAREEMTPPYSDLKWAILISLEDEKCKDFFRNLTNLVNLQVSIKLFYSYKILVNPNTNQQPCPILTLTIALISTFTAILPSFLIFCII